MTPQGACFDLPPPVPPNPGRAGMIGCRLGKSASKLEICSGANPSGASTILILTSQVTTSFVPICHCEMKRQCLFYADFPRSSRLLFLTVV